MDFTLTPEDIERFWFKVDVRGPDDCWLWRGLLSDVGYGRFYVGRRDGNSQTRGSHRISYFIAHGEIPEGLGVLHNCDQRYAPGDISYRACANPSHLWTGTTQQNQRDMVAKGRHAFGERHGAKLHPERMARGANHRSHTRPDSVQRGEKHPSSKLTEVVVRKIRERAAQGEKQKVIARDFGICQQVVSRIVHRKRWGHVA